jgi:hypothetical protein
MVNIGDLYRCSQCNHQAKTKEEIEKLEDYKKNPTK